MGPLPHVAKRSSWYAAPMKALVLAVLLVPIAGYADTIYHCKAYSGGTFWSSDHCSNHKALIDRIATVPSNLAWDQQVSIAEGGRNAARAASALPPESLHDRCGKLKAERDKIWSRYTNWQFQPPEVVGPDRQRTLGIQAEQQRLGCSTQ